MSNTVLNQQSAQQKLSANTNDTPHLRPTLHFTPAKNWLNDPNGLFYLDGTYHLFFQYNPTGDQWGNMHWGHATSQDLITWQEQPIALYPEPEGLGYVFSGGAVVDWHNTSGLGNTSNPPVIATFTHNDQHDVQRQSIAYSLDKGDTWKMYANNPVLDNPGIADFRDPKVVWYEANQCWIMALAVHQKIYFYRSDDLLSWQFLSEFSAAQNHTKQTAHGSKMGVWECPDLFPLQVNETCAMAKISGMNETRELKEHRWVLIVSVQDGAPNQGSGSQYFIGHFDGTKFTAHHQNTLWLDYGCDNYAGISFDNTPNILEKRIMIAWMANHQYAKHTPTSPWRTGMTLAREVTLVNTQHGLRLRQQPILPVGESVAIHHSIAPCTYALNTSAAYQAHRLVYTINNLKQKAELKISNSQNEYLVLKYCPTQQNITVDRSHSGWQHSQLPTQISAPLCFTQNSNTPNASNPNCTNSGVTIVVIIDNNGIEVFAENGLTTLTVTSYPNAQYQFIHCQDNIRITSLERLPVT